MGRMISAFYSPDDNFENVGFVTNNGNVGPAFNDITFMPPAKACNRPVLNSSPADTQPMIAACFSPADGFRYFFYCSQTNDIHWVGIDKNWHHVNGGTVKQVQQPKIPGSILDIAVFFRDGNINMATLAPNGDVTLLVGSPWAAPNAVWASAFLYNIPGAKRIAVFDGAGAGHIIVSTEFDLFEIWYFSNGGFGKSPQPLWTFRQAILDIGACLTPGDGVAHIFVANAPSQLQELVWVPAEVPPVVNQIGFVNFVIGSIGAYTKLGDKHLVMRDAGNDLFLSWFDPGSPLIHYGPWPQTRAC